MIYCQRVIYFISVFFFFNIAYVYDNISVFLYGFWNIEINTFQNIFFYDSASSSDVRSIFLINFC